MVFELLEYVLAQNSILKLIIDMGSVRKNVFLIWPNEVFEGDLYEEKSDALQDSTIIFFSGNR